MEVTPLPTLSLSFQRESHPEVHDVEQGLRAAVAGPRADRGQDAPVPVLAVPGHPLQEHRAAAGHARRQGAVHRGGEGSSGLIMDWLAIMPRLGVGNAKL